MALIPAPGAGAGAGPLLLYSTNTHLKYFIQETYMSEHHVWCSPVFDARTRDRYAPGAGQPGTSDPCTTYRALKAYVEQPDDHEPKVISQRATLSALAVKWHVDGKITEEARDEIVAMVERATARDWRPFIFIIPYAPLAARVTQVPRAKRASHEMEYIIPDLKRAEFEIIEP